MPSCLPACLLAVTGWALPIHRSHALQSSEASPLAACRKASAAGFGGASAAELAALRQQVAEQQSQLDQKDAMLQDLRDLLVGSQGNVQGLWGCSAAMPAAVTGAAQRVAVSSMLDLAAYQHCSKRTPQVAQLVRAALGGSVKGTGTSELRCASLTSCLCPAVRTQDLSAGV